MAKTVYPPQVQAMLDRIKRAKKADADERALAQSHPTRYELTTTYRVNQVQQVLTLPLASVSQLGVWKESEKFLRELFQDDDYELVKADINEWRKPKYTTTNYFFIWDNNENNT